MRRFRPILLMIILALLVFSASMFAGTTGKIRGIVTDSRTGEPIAGANIILQGTLIGGATDVDGIFIILLVPPGDYEVEASMVGYSTKVQENVHVESDRTITLDFELAESILEGETVTVIADRDLVKLDVSASETNVSKEEMQEIPFARNVQDVIGMQAGVTGSLVEGELRIREGEGLETNVLVDGYSMVDSKFAKVKFPVNLQSVEELKVLRGGYNAEYGEARSGIVNIVTKNPEDQLHISLDYRMEPPGYRHDGRQLYDPKRMRAYQLYDGPNSDSATYIVAYEGAVPDTSRWMGWNAYSDLLLNDNNPDNDLTPQEARELWLWRHRPIEYGNLAGHNLDVTVSGGIKLLPWDMNILAGVKYENRPFTYPQALDSYEETAFTIKILNKLSESTNLTLSVFHSDVMTVSNDNAGSSWSNEIQLSYDGGNVEAFYPYRKPWVENKSTLIGLKLLHVFSPTRYFEADLSYFGTYWNTNQVPDSPASSGRYFGGRLYYDPQSGFIPKNLGVQDQVTGYSMSGGVNSTDNSYSERYVAKAAIVDQFHPSHELKAGFEFRINNIVEDRTHIHDDIPAQKFVWKYDVRPLEFSAYVQDKVEFWGMIANLGVRFDYYKLNKELPDVWRTLDFATNRAIFEAMKQWNQFGYVGGDMPVREPEAKFHISPRVGVSFPISENSKVYFNYGHFVQIPNTEAMYSTTNDYGMPRTQWIGNAHLDFQKTYNFELGYDQNVYDWFQMHVGAFYKDYSDVQSGIVFAHTNQSLVLESAVQREYREIRGLEIEFRKATGRFVTGYFNFNITQKSISNLEVPDISQIPIITDNYSFPGAINGELRGVPRPLKQEITPYGRGVLTIGAPEEWGPRIWDYPILHKTKASFGLFYQGPQYTEHPDQGWRTNHPDVKFYTIPFFSSNLRISRDFRIFNDLSGQMYLDISNLWVSKYRVAIPDRNQYYTDLWAQGKTDKVGSDDVKDKRILQTESDVIYQGQHRIYILGIRLSL